MRWALEPFRERLAVHAVWGVSRIYGDRFGMPFIQHWCLVSFVFYVVQPLRGVQWCSWWVCCSSEEYCKWFLCCFLSLSFSEG